MDIKKSISIIVPAYNEADNFLDLFSRIVKTMKVIAVSYEIIIVDDGSTDNTIEILKEEIKKNVNIKLLSFSRNFGHQAALNAGIDYSSGDAVVIMDADMQQPPEMIKDMYQEYLNGYEIVLCSRTSNKQNGIFREKIGRLFYFTMNKISGLDLKPNVADFGLFHSKVICALRQMPEHDRFLRGLVQWVGFKKKFIPYTAESRYHGKSKYNFKKLLGLGMSGITSFSAWPLRISWWFGVIIFCISVMSSMYVVLDYYFGASSIPAGWSSLVIAIALFGGLQLMMIGVVGEYLAKIFNEVKARPLYIIDNKIGLGDSPNKSKYGLSV